MGHSGRWSSVVKIYLLEFADHMQPLLKAVYPSYIVAKIQPPLNLNGALSLIIISIHPFMREELNFVSPCSPIAV